MENQAAVMTTESRLPMEGPWGDQGVMLKEAPTSAEAIKQAGLDWEVALKPTYMGYHDGVPRFVKMPGKLAVTRTDTMVPLSTVGKKWKPIQNTDAFNFFDRFVEEGLCEYHTAGYVNGGEKVFVVAKIKADPMEVIPGDEVDSYFVLTNTHSNVAASKVLFTNIRFVCTNVLPAMERADNQIRMLHMGNIKANIQAVQDIVDMRRKDFSTTLEGYKLLASKQVRGPDVDMYLEDVLTNSQSLMDINGKWSEREDDSSYKNTKNRIVELFETGRGTDIPDVKGTWWGLYNSVVEWYNHTKGRSVDARLSSTFYGAGRKKSEKALLIALDRAA